MEREPIARSKDYERLSVRSCSTFTTRNTVTDYTFDGNRYIPSRQYIRNRQAEIKQQEIFERNKSKRKYPTAKKETLYNTSIFMRKLEEEIFRDKKSVKKVEE